MANDEIERIRERGFELARTIGENLAKAYAPLAEAARRDPQKIADLYRGMQIEFQSATQPIVKMLAGLPPRFPIIIENPEHKSAPPAE